MTTNDSADQRVQDALRRHALWRTSWVVETALSTVMSDPELQRLAGEIEQEELRLGQELSTRLQPFQDRYHRAVHGLDADALRRICPGKHVAAGPEELEQPVPVRQDRAHRPSLISRTLSARTRFRARHVLSPAAYVHAPPHLLSPPYGGCAGPAQAGLVSAWHT